MLRPLLGVLTVIAITVAARLAASAAGLTGGSEAVALIAGAGVAVALGALIYPPAYHAGRANPPRLDS